MIHSTNAAANTAANTAAAAADGGTRENIFIKCRIQSMPRFSVTGIYSLFVVLCGFLKINEE